MARDAKPQPIRIWPISERPRERLLQSGPRSLSDAQLIAVLLRTGRRRSSAVQLGIELLDRFGGLAGVAAAAAAELCAVPGIGPAKAAELYAALELARRALAPPLAVGSGFRSSGEVYAHYFPLLRGLKQEVFRTLLLDGKHRLLREIEVSSGSLNLNIVHPREVFKAAVRESAAAVILLHNHPTGDCTPSTEDRELTRRLVDAGEIMGIRVLDHIIVGDRRYVSFADEGWITH